MTAKNGIRNLLARTMSSGSVKYYVRVRVPTSLVGTYNGKKEIKKSLNTSDRRRALDLLSGAVAEIRHEFDVRKLQLEENYKLTLDDYESKRIVRQWFLERENKRDKKHVLTFDNRFETQDAIDELEDEISTLGLLSDEWAPIIQGVANKLLLENRILISEFSKEYLQLCDYVRRGTLENRLRSKATLSSSHRITCFDPLFGGAVEFPSSQTELLPQRFLVEEFIRAFNENQGSSLSDKKMLEYGMVYKLLREFLGPDKQLRDVDRASLRLIRDALEVLPPNSSKIHKDKSIKEIVVIAKKENLKPLSPNTANGYLQKISTMFKWALVEEYIDRNPATGLKVSKKAEAERDTRNPFSDDQLDKIFKNPKFQQLSVKGKTDKAGKAVSDRMERYWVPLIALYSGMRMNEICQLLTADICVEEGVYVFDLKEDENSGKRLKSHAGKRKVPVHPDLIDLGLVEYWMEQKKAKNHRLFPDLQLDRRGYYSGKFQKWFGRYLEECKAKQPKTSFHSFRHNFRDALRRAGVGVIESEWLCGWERRGTQDRYGQGYQVSQLYEYIEMVEYPELDLSHLK